MKQKIEYAEAVLRGIDEWKRCRIDKSRMPKYTAPAVLARDVHERSIAKSLEQIVENLSTIAVASTIAIPLSVLKTPSRKKAHICGPNRLKYSQPADDELAD
jgi:hypothetical protein